MVGSDLDRLLRSRDTDTIAVGHEELDITDRDAVLYLLKQVRPDIIANCAAFTRVDDCETQEQRATRINGNAVGFLAEGADRWSALLLHISTDFVFDGTRIGPYDEDDPVAPISAYGRSKLRGEREAAKASKHLIVRTSWLFGSQGWNFVEAILRQVREGSRNLRVVDDQQGRPTWTPHLAEALIRLAQVATEPDGPRGVVHYADHPHGTWYDFARTIVDEARNAEIIQGEVAIAPVSSIEFPRPAARPSNSILSTRRYERLTGFAPEDWRDGLRQYLVRKIDS